MSDLTREVRRKAFDAVKDALLGRGDVEPAKSSEFYNYVVSVVTDVLTEDAVVLSKADAKWLCAVIHGEPDTGPADETRYNRAHKLLEP